MEKRGLSLADIQEMPNNSLILLSGPPGAGKSTFCYQAVLSGLAVDKPVIFATTEHGPTEVIGLLEEKGMGEFPPGALSFIDAFGETVGLATTERSDTTDANCEDLNSISMAIDKLRQRIGRRSIILAFDSLTSPYLFNKEEVFRFMRLCLAKFASEGNSVLALVDEGCGKEEDLVAMMSVADGILKMEIKENSRIMNVVKHPKVKPTRIEVPVEHKPTIKATWHYEPNVMRQFQQSFFGKGKTALRREVGDFVNPFWPNLAHWSGMLWDPKGFPKMIYELNKEECSMYAREASQYMPWRWRFLFRLIFSLQALGFLPKNASKVKDMKKMAKLGGACIMPAQMERSGSIEYLDDISKTDEHYFRIYENSDCWGFEKVGTTTASHLPPAMAGMVKAFEKNGSEWNAIETKCIGLGDPYCEVKLVPGEIDELSSSLEKDNSILERIQGQLIDRIMGFLFDKKPLIERPKLGSDVHLHVAMHAMGLPHVAGGRYRMAQRMGGAKSGKEIGQRLIDAGLSEDEAIRRIIDFMNYCKVGKVTLGETIRIRENCEAWRTKLVTTIEEPSCFFTTGFLNGLFSAVKNQHVRETKCIVAGDAYCEWEIV